MSAEIRGIEQVLARFIQLTQEADDLEKPFNTAATYMLGSIEKNFKAQGRPEKWTPLAASTLARRKKGKNKTKTGQILIDSGQMKNSVTPERDGSTLKIGTNVVYAARQHFGYPGGRGRGHSKTPARPWLIFQEEDAAAIQKIFSRWLEQSV